MVFGFFDWFQHFMRLVRGGRVNLEEQSNTSKERLGVYTETKNQRTNTEILQEKGEWPRKKIQQAQKFGSTGETHLFWQSYIK